MAFRRFPRAALPIVAVLVTACGDSNGPSHQALAAMMIGEWTHSRRSSAPAETPVLNAGFFVSIVIDSARETRFWGRVTQWIIGDVGLPANRFGPVSGTLDSAYGVVLRIEAGSAQGAPAFRIDGEVLEDQLIVHASWTEAGPGPFPLGCRFQRLH